MKWQDIGRAFLAVVAPPIAKALLAALTALLLDVGLLDGQVGLGALALKQSVSSSIQEPILLPRWVQMDG